jgi:hypothetical protein
VHTPIPKGSSGYEFPLDLLRIWDHDSHTDHAGGYEDFNVRPIKPPGDGEPTK